MTSEDAPANTAIGGMRKRAIITYAARASIAYLVKNFTNCRTRCPRPPPAPANASTPPLIPRYEIHTSAPPPITPAGAATSPRASAHAAAAMIAHAAIPFRSTRRSTVSMSVTRRSEGLREGPNDVQDASREAKGREQPDQPRRADPSIERVSDPPPEPDGNHERQEPGTELVGRTQHRGVGLAEKSHVSTPNSCSARSSGGRPSVPARPACGPTRRRRRTSAAGTRPAPAWPPQRP